MTLFVISSIANLNAQITTKNVNIKQIKVENGLAMSRVNDIICDQQNIIWIKSNRGLQYWDGQDIRNFVDSTLEVGQKYHIYKHPSEGIYLATPGKLRHIHHENLSIDSIYQSTNSTFSPIPISKNGVLAILTHPDSIVEIKEEGSIHKKRINKTSVSRLKFIREFIQFDELYAYNASSHSLYMPQSKDYFEHLQKENFRFLRNNLIIEKNLVVLTSKTGLILKNGKNQIHIPFPDNRVTAFYSSLLKKDERTIIVGVDNELFEFDIKDNIWTKVYKNIDQQNLLTTGYFDKLIFDKHHNIWVVTVNEGLLKIYNNDVFDYFGLKDKKQNFVKNIVADERANRIIASALHGGIVVYDTLGNVLHHLTENNSHGAVRNVTGIYPFDKNHYIFNNLNDSIIYSLKFVNNAPQIEALISKRETYLYYQDAVQYDDNTSYLLFNTLYELQHAPLSIDSIFLFQSSKSCMIRDDNLLWIGCIDGILKYNIKEPSAHSFIELPGQGFVRSISKWKNDSLLIGSDKGLSVFDPKKENTKLIFENCIYCVLQDSLNNIWAGTGNGIYRFDEKLRKTQYSIYNGLQNNEFNTNSCVKSASGKLYFGGVNGITAFHPEDILQIQDSVHLFIKELVVNNESKVKNASLGNIDPLDFDYRSNNLSFNIVANGKHESDHYTYQYFVKGLSSEWINAEHQTRYNFNLSPGNYKFYFKASHSFDPEAKLENPLEICIKSPWWQQKWFYITSLIALIGSISFVIRNREKQKFLKKKYEWDLQYQRQEDRIKLSKELHDNIGSRLTFLVSSIENIKSMFQANGEKAVQKMDSLSDFGKDTIDDLRSMMWVLTQPFISLQDLQLKVLDFISIAKNTYPNIEFHYDGPKSNLDTELDSNLSQNVFRIVQEAIHNSVKHASPRNICISLSMEGKNLNVRIEDDGVGFDKNEIKQGHGIHNIKSRLLEHSAELQMDSSGDTGTALYFTVVVKD